MASGTFQVKRIYDPPSASDGARVLVDRLWPRGLRKEDLELTLWHKDVAPSPALRKWFHQNRDRWEEFEARYRAELDANPEVLTQLYELQKRGRVTLLYGTRDKEHNHAQVLADYLRTHGRKRQRA
jgi:uncharacterized protein YeaO (DUF488 family)